MNWATCKGLASDLARIIGVGFANGHVRVFRWIHGLLDRRGSRFCGGAQQIFVPWRTHSSTEMPESTEWKPNVRAGRPARSAQCLTPSHYWGLVPVGAGHGAVGAVELLVVPLLGDDGLVVLLVLPADPLAEPGVAQGEPGVPLGLGVVVLLLPAG